MFIKEYAIVTVVSAILIAGVLTLPLAFSHQSVDAANVKVKSMKNTIKNKIQALTRVAVTGNDGIVPMVALAPVQMVTQVLVRMEFRVPKGAEASLLLSPALTVLAIRQEPVELQELEVLTGPPELDVLAPAAVEVLVEPVELEEAILAQRVVLLVALLVNLIPAELLHV